MQCDVAKLRAIQLIRVGYTASLSRSVECARSSRRFCANYVASMRAENTTLDEFVNIGEPLYDVTGNSDRGTNRDASEFEKKLEARIRGRATEGGRRSTSRIYSITVVSTTFSVFVPRRSRFHHLWIFFARAKLLFIASTCRVFSTSLFIHGDSLSSISHLFFFFLFFVTPPLPYRSRQIDLSGRTRRTESISY